MIRRRTVTRLLVLAGIAGAVFWVFVNRNRIDPTAIDDWLSGFGIWAPLIYVLSYTVGTIAFAPGSLFALASGALFGPVWGAILNLLGATLGSALAFIVARHVAGDWVERKAAGRLKQLVHGVEAEGWRFVAFVRLVPLFPFNLANYAFGLTRIGFLPYVVTSFVCMAPGAFAYAWLGYAGREAIAGDATAIRYGLLALGLLAAIAFLPRLIRRLRGPAINWIDPEELRRRFSEGTQPTLIDVRGTDEFNGALGHIAGAMNIPLDELDQHDEQLRKLGNENVVVVCKTDRRSVVAFRVLKAAGIESLSVLRGGMQCWNMAHSETVRHLQPDAGSRDSSI